MGAWRIIVSTGSLARHHIDGEAQAVIEQRTADDAQATKRKTGGHKQSQGQEQLFLGVFRCERRCRVIADNKVALATLLSAWAG